MSLVSNLLLVFVILLQVGNIEGAKQAIEAGADGIIVQGLEAGGHVIGQVCMFLIILMCMYICSVCVLV